MSQTHLTSRPRPPHPAHRYPVEAIRPVIGSFTPRQTAVLAWVASGASNGEIAHHLAIGIKTVEAELTHILRALRVATRVEAAVIWALLPPDHAGPSHTHPPDS